MSWRERESIALTHVRWTLGGLSRNLAVPRQRDFQFLRSHRARAQIVHARVAARARCRQWPGHSRHLEISVACPTCKRKVSTVRVTVPKRNTLSQIFPYEGRSLPTAFRKGLGLVQSRGASYSICCASSWCTVRHSRKMSRCSSSLGISTPRSSDSRSKSKLNASAHTGSSACGHQRDSCVSRRCRQPICKETTHGVVQLAQIRVPQRLEHGDPLVRVELQHFSEQVHRHGVGVGKEFVERPLASCMIRASVKCRSTPRECCFLSLSPSLPWGSSRAGGWLCAQPRGGRSSSRPRWVIRARG